MPRVKYHAGKCLVTGRYGWHCRDEGVEEGGGCAQREGNGMEKRRCQGAVRAWEKGRALEAQIDLERKKGPLLPFCQISGFSLF